MNKFSDLAIKNRQHLNLVVNVINNPEVSNAPINDQGQTWLHLACAEGGIQIVKFLLQYSTEDSVEVIDKNLQTPLHYACIAGHKEIVNLLLQKKSYYSQ
ncbi:MAG: ankyrin repeat domain-containing protein [Candidatus Midichloria sp.]|nr:ankyrin repeat domain-containing protein [Candidatus Midichloria sp.]